MKRQIPYEQKLAYRVRMLPSQLKAARAKLARLEEEAREYRMLDLLGADTQGQHCNG